MGDIADLTTKAYEIARLIPPGSVTTYGKLVLSTRIFVEVELS
jgi:alkylated DNA nucleotide flippase Atl1